MDHGDKNCEADSKSYEEKWTEIQKLGVLGDEPALVIYTSGTTGNPKVYYFVIKFYPLLLNFDMIIMHMPGICTCSQAIWQLFGVKARVSMDLLKMLPTLTTKPLISVPNTKINQTTFRVWFIPMEL